MKIWWLGLFAVLLAGCGLAAGRAGQNTGMKDSLEQKVTGNTTASPTVQVSKPSPSSVTPPDLPGYGLAPELENSIWLNVDHPLRLQDLRGKVVLLDMWTFDCINCQHVIPSLRSWYQEYKDQGFIVIGNHFPEFQYESQLGNLKDAIQRLDVSYLAGLR
jgi:thiol-disulfide isomerase/thioredoxin